MTADVIEQTMVIVITRAEGPSHLCGKPHTCTTFAEANTVLRSWATGVAEVGYDKCDFSLVDPSLDLDYLGRFDLEHPKKGLADLQAHVISHLEFTSGQHCPSYMDPAKYDHLINGVYQYTDEYKAAALVARDHIAKLN